MNAQWAEGTKSKEKRTKKTERMKRLAERQSYKTEVDRALRSGPDSQPSGESEILIETNTAKRETVAAKRSTLKRAGRIIRVTFPSDRNQ